MINELKIKTFDMFMYSIMLFPIMTVLIDSGLINKLLFGLLIISYLLIILNKKINKKSFVIIILMLLGYLMSIINTEFPLVNSNMFFYYPFIIIYMLFMDDYKKEVVNWFLNKEKTVRFIMKLWSFIVGISIFIPSCYYVKEGGEIYFGSFVNTIFRLGPSCILIMSLVLISISLYKRKNDIVYTIVPMYSCFMGSSRTYLAIAIFIFLINLYVFFNNKKKFLLTLIPIIIISGVIIINTSIYKKILFTLDDSQYGDFWFRITSSRSEFWEKDLLAWSNEPIIKKIFGAGLNFTYTVSNLWGHNDFVEILCANGVIGLFIYLYIMIKSIFKVKNSSQILFILTFLVWFLNAFFNMHYTYFCCVLGLPFILIAIENYSLEIRKNKIEEKNK